MHSYSVKSGDIVNKTFYPDGQVLLYSVAKDGKPANGWSSKTYYADGHLLTEENFSNGQLIEKISYDEQGNITTHKIWNNRLKQLTDKPEAPPMRRPNVVTGHGNLYQYLQQLPAISEFMLASFDKTDMLRSYEAFIHSEQEEGHWKMQGQQMSFSIYWEHGEISHQWHCHCDNEVLYWKAREFLAGKI